MAAARERRLVRGAAGALAVAALVLGAGRAIAQDDEVAAQLFRAGSAAYERHDYRAAAQAFEEAYRRKPRAGAMYGAAIAWEAAAELPRAADAYDTALRTGGLDEEEARDARSRLEALERTLGLVEVQGKSGDTASVAHARARPLPARVHLPPGRHELRVERGAQHDTRAVTVVEGGTTRISVDFPAPGGPPVASAPGPVPRPAAPLVASAPGSSRRTWGWVAMGGAAALSVGAVVLGLEALASNDEFDAHPRDADLRDRTLALRAWTNVAWGAAAVAGITGFALVLTAPSGTSGKPKASRAASLEPLRVRF